MLKKIIDGFFAGVMISIGGAVLLSCDDRYIGAFMFTIALLVICFRGFSLYTGKIGFMAYSHTKADLGVLLFGLLGNVIGTLGCGLALSYAFPAMAEKASAMCALKLAQDFPVTLIRAIFCGILMYIAVAIYKENKSVLGIIFCVPVFILSGFEHSIADMFYFGVSLCYSFKTLWFILTVILGNTIGGLLIPVLSKVQAGKNDGKN